MNFRKLHRQLAPILFLPLLLTALTGVAYRLGRSWFDLPSPFGRVMMTLHEGRFLGQPLVPLYVLWLGLGLIGLIGTGVTMLRWRKKSPQAASRWTVRSLHRWLAPICLIPLFVSASTGILYRLGNSWFQLPKSSSQLLLRIHQGSYLGSQLRVIYVLLVGLGLLLLLVTGLQMTSLFRQLRQRH